jgi:hypothetical protein
MSRRHVALLSTSYPRREGDPSGHFVRSEARRLSASGHRVTVVAPNGGCHDPGVRVIALPGGSAFGWPGVVARLKERPRRVLDAAAWCVHAACALPRLAPDEVIAHFVLPSLFPVALAARCPVTAVAHGSDVALFTRLPRTARYRLAAHFVERDVRFRFVAERLRDDLVRAAGPHGPALVARSMVAPCPIEVGTTTDRVTARKRLGLGDQFLAVSATRLVPGKRIDWALAHAPVPSDARWVVLGDGPELGRMKHAHPKAEFLGQVDREVALTWLAAADVLVVCSEREGAPTVIREARLLGTPVWTNAVGDVSRWAETDPGIRVLAELDPSTRPA